MKDQDHRTQRRPLAGWGVFALVGVLLCFGALNIAVRATWHKLEDGVLWEARPEGVTAVGRGGARHGAMAAGIRPATVLVAIDGAPIENARGRAARARPGASSPSTLSYTVLRLGQHQMLTVEVAPAPGGNSTLYFILRGDRDLHAARRRLGAASAPERSRDAALLLAVPGVFRHADVFVQPARSARLVFLLGRRRRHAAARRRCSCTSRSCFPIGPASWVRGAGRAARRRCCTSAPLVLLVGERDGRRPAFR